MLRTLKQRFLLKRYFWPPKCIPSINIAYERCYFPQKLLSGSTLLSKRCYDPHFLVVSGIDCISYCGGSSLQE
jgi:hypothetical protein